MGLYIGNVWINGNIFLGPMAGVTDLPFRLLCREKGAALVYTEMVSAKGILYHNTNTESLLMVSEEERPTAVQLFGADPDILSAMAMEIDYRNFDILDINMGCPVLKVVNNGEGSALMKNPRLVGKIVRSVSAKTQKPVTVKIRKGYEHNSDNAVEVAKIAEQNGAAAIAVHARTREQFYSGVADWDVIKRVKEAVKIPVIGSGDIFTCEDAKRMLEQTKCDAIMVARGARGNPWIFEQINAYLTKGIVLPKPDFREVEKMILRHAGLVVGLKGEFTGIREMRKQVAWYTAGYPGSAKFRSKMNDLESMDDLIRLVEDYEKQLEL